MTRPVDQASDDLPSVDLEVIIRTEVKHTLVSHGVDERDIRSRLYAVLQHSATVDLMPSMSELCLTLLDDQEIHELNRDYRGRDRPTDVLSFALLEGEQVHIPPDIAVPLGDIMISIDTALRQTQRGALARLSPAIRSETHWGLSEEVSFLALHGLLHLLGYDHEEEQDAEEMEALELMLLPTLLYGE